MTRKLWALVLAGCSSGPAAGVPDAAPTASDAQATGDDSPLVIDSLGVQGFVLRRGGDAVLTAPLFTRQSAIEVALNVPLSADPVAIDAGLAGVALDDVRAIVSGHAHYDHLLDVPHLLARAPGATAYTNLSGRRMLAALAPDRPGCTNPPPAVPLPRARVVAVDDELASYVDYTNCPDEQPPGAPLEGRWIAVPGSRVRMMPVCSTHPPQIGPYHFGEGSIVADQCELPPAASGWLEGRTLAFVIDFLDDAGAPAFRVFYQDAPTNAPVGHLPPHMLSEKPVDVALLCVGSTDAVNDHPGALVSALAPRYGLSGHWEDFFQPVDATPQPIPLLDLDAYLARAEAALPGSADAPLVVDGELVSARHLLVQPMAHIEVPIAR